MTNLLIKYEFMYHISSYCEENQTWYSKHRLTSADSPRQMECEWRDPVCAEDDVFACSTIAASESRCPVIWSHCCHLCCQNCHHYYRQQHSEVAEQLHMAAVKTYHPQHHSPGIHRWEMYNKLNKAYRDWHKELDSMANLMIRESN